LRIELRLLLVPSCRLMEAPPQFPLISDLEREEVLKGGDES
jgi:hypothetical protein